MKINVSNVPVTREGTENGKLYCFLSGPHCGTVFLIQDEELFLFKDGTIRRHCLEDDGIYGEQLGIYRGEVTLEN